MDDALAASWAHTEFGAAQLGNQSRTRRLVELADTLAKQPAAGLPQATHDPAQLQAAYRFFDNDHFATSAVLASHVTATTTRCADAPLILAAQDTTFLDYSTHAATTDLGPLATPQQRGLVAHTTTAFTPLGVPLGVLAQQTWARDPATVGKAAQRRALPITEKESYKWLASVQAVNEAARACPATRFVAVGDREADIYDLWLMERAANVDVLVRAAWNRNTHSSEGKLWATVQAANHQTSVGLTVGRQPGQPARRARLTVRWCPVTLEPPQHRQREGLPGVSLWAVHAVEEHPPDGVEGVQWLLLTTVAVESAAEAEERLEWYAVRWGCEVLHKVLKSGCRIEARQLASAARLERVVAVYSVVAWRILNATMLARAVPDLPCTVLLEVEEWQALYCTVQQTARVPAHTPRLGEAVQWIAQLGGHLGRKGDGPPGVTVLWRGFQRLSDLTLMYRLLRTSPKT
jgi:hypothetical protein